MEKRECQISLTCSSNQVHSSADAFGSFATEVASPTRAHGMRYCNKPEKRNGSDDLVEHSVLFGLPCRSTLLLQEMCQPTIVLMRHMKLDIVGQSKSVMFNQWWNEDTRYVIQCTY